MASEPKLIIFNNSSSSRRHNNNEIVCKQRKMNGIRACNSETNKPKPNHLQMTNENQHQLLAEIHTQMDRDPCAAKLKNISIQPTCIRISIHMQAKTDYNRL